MIRALLAGMLAMLGLCVWFSVAGQPIIGLSLSAGGIGLLAIALEHSHLSQRYDAEHDRSHDD